MKTVEGVWDTRSLYGDTRSLYGDTRSLYGDTRSLYGDTHSLYGDTHSLYGDTRSLYGDTRSLYGDTRSLYGDARSLYGDARSLYGDTRSLYGDTRSLYGDTRSLYGDTRSLCGDTRSLYGDTRSNTNMQSRTESHVAVPIDVRRCSSIDERERRETGNFLSLLSIISCCYNVNMPTANKIRGTPVPPSCFLNGFTKYGKTTLQKREFRYKPEHFHPCIIKV